MMLVVENNIVILKVYLNDFSLTTNNSFFLIIIRDKIERKANNI